jgi:hypothetical protein
MSAGAYSATITISASGATNTPQTVPVSLTIQYTLSTSGIPAGGGDINPSSGTYDSGVEVTIRAIPASGYRFDHWAGNTSGTSPIVQLVMDGDKDIIAYFTRTYTLSVSCTPPGSGTVNTSGGIYDEGKQVTLTATPSKNYKFDGWSGDASSSSSNLTITMTSNKAIVASFSLCDICIYHGEQPPYAKTDFSYNTINLVENPNAADQTWAQLKAFITADKTDERTYVPGIYMCGAFAEDVHNNAEAAGIKAAWVSIDFQDGSAGHALNAFETTDKGLVYVDCTSSSDLSSAPVCHIDPSTGRCIFTNGEPSSYDRVAYLSIGKVYGLISLSSARGFSYTDYVMHCQQEDAYDTALNQYNSALETYNANLAAYEARCSAYDSLYDRCGGYATTGECQTLTQLYNNLESQHLQLDSQYSQLNNQYASLNAQEAALGDLWEPLGVVSKVELYW